MKKKKMRFPLKPKHPERVCWGCEKYCPTGRMLCGNGSDRSQHPIEIIGEDWYETLTEEDREKIEIV
ncbi:MAG: DUF3079 domain-containing protein [Xanthomonadaceae bacterium]|nr:DUF3079 domain-containing protein [Xanthomonadaceae bacterium]